MARQPGTPFPQEHLDLLESVHTTLDAVQRPARQDSEPLILAAVQKMDRLMDLVSKFDQDAFPDGSVELLREARYWVAGAAIDYGMFDEAVERVRLLCESWDEYWKDKLPEYGLE
ncbi:MAG: hypothetical protein WEE89_08935 [Gemmatimonadota bacterium]